MSESTLLPSALPSNSQTRTSSPRQLTLTALPRAVISASLMPDVWPQSLMPGDMESDDAFDVQRYSMSVLSGRVARM